MAGTYQRRRFSFIESMSFEYSIETIRKILMMGQLPIEITEKIMFPTKNLYFLKIAETSQQQS